MFFLKCVLLSLLASGSCASLDILEAPVVDLGYVKYRGKHDPAVGTVTYHGIKYAAPPTGSNRWRAPLDIETHGGYSRGTVLDARNPGPSCTQGSPVWYPLPVAGGSEDCLLLDVIAPETPADQRLPVILEIPGGGYTMGSTASYPGYGMVKHAKGKLLFVQIQYRLGVYGFLSGSEVRKNGTANAGLLDQRLAIEWVRQHIHAFGGDPDKITIAGGSAGGGSVLNQMIMYGGLKNPPFRAAIAEYPWWQPYHPDDIIEGQYQTLLTTAGCKDLECLRNLSEAALAKASQSSYTKAYHANPPLYGWGDFFYGPSVDGHIIKELPSEAFQNNNFSSVPTVIDREELEGEFFSNKLILTPEQIRSDLQQLWPAASTDFLDALMKLYPSRFGRSSYTGRAQIFGDAIVNCGSAEVATTVSRWSPVWKMKFNAGSKIHAATKAFLYELQGNGQGSTPNATLAEIMKDYFVSFAINLDPNKATAADIAKAFWPKYKSGESRVLDVNATSIGTIRDPDQKTGCQFFRAHGDVIKN